MTAPTLDLSLPGDGELRATVTGAGGIDPWVEHAKVADARPGDITAVAGVFAGSGGEMDRAYTAGGAAQSTLGASFTNGPAQILDRDIFYAKLPAGFRDAGTQLADSSRSLNTVAADLTTAMERAGATVRALVDDLAGKRREWQGRVEAANPIPPADVGAWLANRDAFAATMASTVAVAGAAVGAAITTYEASINQAVRLLADQGHVPLDQVASMAAPGAEYAGAVDPATLGTPAGAGTAADPVNTGTGNFVEIETDLGFGALVAGLTWTRVYNSRSDRSGPFGPRWSSWASARLRDTPAGAEFTGPDGGRLFFPVDGDGFRSVGTAARVRREPTGLVLSWPDGRCWSFDPAGRPLVTSTGPGTEVTFAHDAAGQLVELGHPGGRRVTLSWEHGRVTAAAASDGRRVAYRYENGHLVAAGGRRYGIDLDGFLATVTDADGVVELVNSYDDAGRVTEQLTPFGRTVRFAYEPGGVTTTTDDTGGPRNTFLHDGAGRLVGSIDGHGHTTALRRDAHGRIVAVTDRTGAVTTQDWDARGRLVGRVPPSGVQERYTHDEDDRLTAVTLTGTDGGRARTGFTYTGAERTPSEIEDPEGGITRLAVRNGLVSAVTDADGVTVRLTHDDDGALLSAVDAAGGVARIERDAAGRPRAAVSPAGHRTTLGYDARGLLVSRTDPDGARWRFEHSAAGRPTAVVDPLGGRTEYRHGPHGERTGIVDALGIGTTLAHDPFGNVAAVTAGDGAKQTFRHDALSRLSAWTDPAGGTWLREHDAEGRLTASVDPDGVRAAAEFDAAGRVTALRDGLTGSTFAYDGFGRAIAHVRPDGAALRATFDRCGRLLTQTGPEGGVTRYEHTPAGRLRRIVSAAGRVTTFGYDGCGRAATSTDGIGGRWSQRHDADGRLVERTSAAGLVETFAHDACGRLTVHTAPGVGASGWEYDAAGRVVAVVDRAGRRTFARDAAGRVVAATDALGHTTRYGYDVAGHVIAITDPLGATWSRSHDENGRLSSETDPLGNVTRYRYDGAGRLIERRDATGGVARYRHDVSGRVSAIGGDVDIAIERDLLGRPVRITEPGVPEIGLGYDRSGRLIERRSGDRVLHWTYDADGLPVARTHPDGSSLIRDRDAAGRTIALTHPLLGRIELERDADGRLLDLRASDVHRTWSYGGGLLTGYQAGSRATRLHRDDRGRVTAVEADGAVVRHGYDSAGQLVSAGDRSFRYDPCGRLAAETGPREHRRDFAYDAAGRLVRAGSEEYTSDAAGRRTGPRPCTYDALDRPSGVGSTALVVDALGELVQAGDTPLLWDTADPLSPLVQLGDRTLVGDGHPWAATAPETWLAPDWQDSIGGSPTADPWGGAGPGPVPGYRGELAVEGLIWLRHRTYDPTTRAFTTPDPLPAVPGTAHAGNPYHYAGNDPVNQLDPLGLRPMTDADVAAQRDDGGIVGAVGDWFGDNWEYVAGGAMVVAGGALMLTGVGGVAGLALMGASGALFAAGASTISQKATTGAVNWGQVGVEGAVGFGTGVVGGAAGAAAARVGDLIASAPATGLLGEAATRASASAPLALDSGAAAKSLLTTGQAAAPGASLGSASGRATMIADASGTVVPTSRSVLERGFQDAGFPTWPTKSSGMGYTFPDGSKVRVMDAAGPAADRASFANPNGNPVSPFTDKPPQPPADFNPAVDGPWKKVAGSMTHINLEP